ncbi:hypothetical protein HWV23_08000 [Natronomonas halophila]|uniref:hypothetical protein n=1 Tax=Natronomonas halophila TaxID=2747817 RepID=UPI0015B6F52A|nr:hypothetical protein [Natronomonas halophila]QLD85668.1 hypothetical protein HWV23_08000 [Natronomonas halophila]
MKQNEIQTRRGVLKTISTGVVGGLALTGGASAQANGGLQRELAEVRAATAQYNDPENALADGYLPEEEAVCGMGYHYPHEDFVSAMQSEDPAKIAAYLNSLDRTEPPVLAYGEGDDGLVLGAVEYLTLDDEEDLFTSTEEDHWHPFFGPLYAMHAWVHNHNPEGVFHPINPRPQFSKPEWCDDGGGEH